MPLYRIYLAFDIEAPNERKAVDEGYDEIERLVRSGELAINLEAEKVKK